MSAPGSRGEPRGASEGPLATLEALRRDSVDALARRVAEAQAQLAQREALRHELTGACLRCEQSLQQERQEFALASSVRQLQGLEGRLRAQEAELEELRARVRRAALREQEARSALDTLTQELLASERARRAASGMLDSQRSESLKLSARAEEDAAEEAFRAPR